MKHSRNAFEGLARFGYAARGLVYLVMSGLALFSGGWGQAENSQGALSTLLRQPFGRVLLAAMAIGFFGFVAWRVAQGVFNADHRPRDLKNGLVRAGKLISGAVYLSLGFLAGGMALGLRDGNSGEGSEEGWTAALMGMPFGPFLVIAIGLGTIGGGIGQIWKAVSGAYRKRLDIPRQLEKPLILLCTYGIAARGVVFVILGGFLVYAALTAHPGRAGSIGEALDWVRSLPLGGVLYTLVALGLLAFAASCLVFALYRRVDAPDATKVTETARSAAHALQHAAGRT